MGFIDFVVKPSMQTLFASMHSSRDDSEANGGSSKIDALVTNLQTNYEYWKTFGQANLDVGASLVRMEAEAHTVKPMCKA